MIAVSHILLLLMNERLRARRRLIVRQRIGKRFDSIDLLRFLPFIFRHLKFVGFPGIRARRRIFVARLADSLALQKFGSAEAAEITRIRINLSAICALNHKRLALIFRCNFYAPTRKKFSFNFNQRRFARRF